MTTSELSTLGLGVLMGMLAFLVKRRMDEYDKMHAEHRGHAEDMMLHETQRDRDYRMREMNSMTQALNSHAASDDRRFEALNVKMDSLASVASQILTLVRNGNSNGN